MGFFGEFGGTGVIARLRNVAQAFGIEELAFTFLEQSGDAIFIKDLDFRYLYMNAAGASLFGLCPEEVVGKSDFDLFPPEMAGEIRKQDIAVMEGAMSNSIEESGILGGRYTVFQTTKSSVLDAMGSRIGLIGIARDITQQKEKERERLELIRSLEAAKDALEREKAMKDQLVANLSHDLRSPLTVARITSQVVSMAPLAPAALEHFMVRIRSALDRADKMICNLLDFSRIESGRKLSLNCAQVDLREAITQFCQELAVLYPERIVYSEACLPSGINGWWDKCLLQRVFENLVHNAIQHGSQDSPVNVELGTADGEAWFSVHNKGEPVPEAHQNLLFDRFHRAAEDCGTGKPGWGLGLAIVKSLVEVQGGRVTLTSNAESGTTFLVSLPLERKFSD